MSQSRRKTMRSRNLSPNELHHPRMTTLGPIGCGPLILNILQIHGGMIGIGEVGTVTGVEPIKQHKVM
jgi:hypothetical protein